MNNLDFLKKYYYLDYFKPEYLSEDGLPEYLQQSNNEDVDWVEYLKDNKQGILGNLSKSTAAFAQGNNTSDAVRNIGYAGLNFIPGYGQILSTVLPVTDKLGEGMEKVIANGYRGGIGSTLSNIQSYIPGSKSNLALTAGVAGLERMFGSKINDENVNKIKNNITNTNNWNTNATTYDSLAYDVVNSPMVNSISQNQVGKDGSGFFGIGKPKRAKNLYNKLNTQVDLANDRLNNKIFDARAGVANNVNLNMNKNYYNNFALGGNLFENGGDLFNYGLNFNNGLQYVNAGSTHENNPYQGVPISINEQDGQPNLVEEGEVIAGGDYVFSNRLTVPDDLARRLGVPRGKTYAEAVKYLSKESEELPNDPIVKRGLQDTIAKLQESQEQLKQEQQEQEQAMQAILSGQYADGGTINIKEANKGLFTKAAKKAGMGTQEYAHHILANKDDYSTQQIRRANFARNAAGWQHANGGHIYDGTKEGTNEINPYYTFKNVDGIPSLQDNRGRNFALDAIHLGNDGKWYINSDNEGYFYKDPETGIVVNTPPSFNGGIIDNYADNSIVPGFPSLNRRLPSGKLPLTNEEVAQQQARNFILGLDNSLGARQAALDPNYVDKLNEFYSTHKIFLDNDGNPVYDENGKPYMVKKSYFEQHPIPGQDYIVEGLDWLTDPVGKATYALTGNENLSNALSAASTIFGGKKGVRLKALSRKFRNKTPKLKPFQSQVHEKNFQTTKQSDGTYVIDGKKYNNVDKARKAFAKKHNISESTTNQTTIETNISENKPNVPNETKKPENVKEIIEQAEKNQDASLKDLKRKYAREEYIADKKALQELYPNRNRIAKDDIAYKKDLDELKKAFGRKMYDPIYWRGVPYWLTTKPGWGTLAAAGTLGYTGYKLFKESPEEVNSGYNEQVNPNVTTLKDVGKKLYPEEFFRMNNMDMTQEELESFQKTPEIIPTSDVDTTIQTPKKNVVPVHTQRPIQTTSEDEIITDPDKFAFGGHLFGGENELTQYTNPIKTTDLKTYDYNNDEWTYDYSKFINPYDFTTNFEDVVTEDNAKSYNSLSEEDLEKKYGISAEDLRNQEWYQRRLNDFVKDGKLTTYGRNFLSAYNKYSQEHNDGRTPFKGTFANNKQKFIDARNTYATTGHIGSGHGVFPGSKRRFYVIENGNKRFVKPSDEELKYFNIGPEEKNIVENSPDTYLDYLLTDKDIAQPTSSITPTSTTSTQQQEETPKVKREYLPYSDDSLRYVPLGINTASLLYNTRPVDFTSADRYRNYAEQMGTPISSPLATIGNYRRRNPYDESYTANMINQTTAANNRQSYDIAGGNRAMQMGSQSARDYTNLQQLSQNALAAYQANRTDDTQVADFNRTTDEVNVKYENARNQYLSQFNNVRDLHSKQALINEAIYRQGLRDQRDVAIANDISRLSESLSGLGEETREENILRWLYNNGVLAPTHDILTKTERTARRKDRKKSTEKRKVKQNKKTKLEDVFDMSYPLVDITPEFLKYK